jgi:hypothetical protein
LNEVFNNFYGAEDSPADTTGKPDNALLTVSNSGDTVQGALNSRPIVVAKATDAGDDIINVVFVDFFRVKDYFSLGKASFGGTPQVEDYFQ